MLSNTVVVFDLDDTLYHEVDYQHSGYQYLINLCARLFQKDISEIITLAKNNKSDVLDAICDHLQLPHDVKLSLLWQYRLHVPSITLSNDVSRTLGAIKKHAQAVAIITDGREISQRLKIEALGLSDIETLVSEGWGETKPGIKRFKYLMAKYPNKHYVYIGDNIKKDFVTPNKLGWQTVGILDSGKNVHSQNIEVETGFLPNTWIKSFKQLHNYFELKT
ncbi:HAD family hydrolase [Paraferrimonas sp. SM1919]|uniref:HAD family hydrolase n=1 Tax=Paraferrimonas sp. SM1919 TaxID=2662263 RepID=UPI0013D06C74|nr:HAD family hydrolase [Paraferrimonas sp. SM1919]